MIRPGLCSVTLRSATPDEVIEVAARAGLAGIEWGADVHVPAGDEAEAARVRAATERAGLAVTSYGSYFLRRGEPDLAGFDAVLASARVLGAPRIRIWAGSWGSAEATPEGRAALERVVREAGASATAAGIELAFEFHGGTLTDTTASTVNLLGALPGVGTYWQPPVGLADDAAVAGLERVIDRVDRKSVV